ncbi:SusC/RagA family TonB-linked outer membrane protein [Compostibacter hankyongensis]|uniref:SusC/RagA family TonB-linked outer membrane protein n=1 Tax=Compostibacter hankyongensis TaxID=1007089 RepID=A0ABP8FUH7_9BACT
MRFLYLLRTKMVLPFALCLLAQGTLFAQQNESAADTAQTPEAADTLKWLKKIPLQERDTVGYFPNNELFLHSRGAVSKADMNELDKMPYTSVDQMLVGRVNGVDVRNNTGEPGKRVSVFVRGTSRLLFKNSDLFYAQPTFVVDGVPMILDHPFAYDIQGYDFNRLGTEINLLSFLDLNDIESIEVLKDFSAGAKYGPNAANGVINITTKGPRSGKMHVSVNGYIGYSLKPQIEPVNAKFERDFRQQFYEKYATDDQLRAFPRYLSDSTKLAYFGPANWDDLYYRNAWSNGIQASVDGGTRLANFRFSLNHAAQQGVADETGMQRYGLNFGINIMPVRNLLLTTYIAAATVHQDRSRWIRDRIGDEDYLLNLENPPSPNKDFLSQYYKNVGNGINNNRNNSVRALANAQYRIAGGFMINSRLGIDYGQNFRDLFIPTTISDGNNFVSNFDGLNRRLTLDNSIAYTKKTNNGHAFQVTLGQYDQWDKWRYDFGKAYRGNSDYIKIYQPGNNDNHQGASNNLRLTANYKDYTQNILASFYGDIAYNYQGKYFLDVYLREDGSSNVPKANRWLFSPTVSAAWKISSEDFLKDNPLVGNLKLRASWGRVGRTFLDEYYKDGPIYNVDVGWDGTPDISTYNAFPAINAAFGTGYVSPDITWAYVEQGNIGLDASFFHDRLGVQVDFYSKTDHNLLLKVPTVEEEGYTGIIENGLSIRNYGYEVTLSGSLVQGDDFGWDASLTAYSNQNELKALPGGLTDLVVDGHRLLVGKPVDRYWVLINEGIYNSDADIPVNPQTGKGLSYKGIPLQAGDPKWQDLNGDYVIDDQDRVMRGRLSPAVMGGFSTTLRYRQLQLNLLFTYAFDRKVINQYMADRFDFVNREGVDDISGVKEVNFWSKEGDYSLYPLYNPWSPVDPYQADQTLFLEDASFVKLRGVTLTYDFGKSRWLQRSGIEGLRVYGTANNLWTGSKYSGGDPEAVDFFGYDQGYYNMPAPRSFTLGFNFQF